MKNNPLSYADPSGYFFKKLFKKIGNFFKKHGRTILAIAVTAFVPGLAGGFLSGMISSGGDLKQGLIGALSAGVFGAIGSGFGPTAGLSIAGKAAKVLAHGTAGGAMSVLRGGKFKEGFVSAGFSQVLEVTNTYSRLGVSGSPRGFSGFAKNTAVSALVGGTASKIVGGKFANGAITGAFSRMFNDVHMAKLNAKIPWVFKKAYEYLSGEEMISSGGAAGVAFSRPTFRLFNDKGQFDMHFRGEFDFGFVLDIDVGGTNIGYGSADMSYTYSTAKTFKEAAGYSASISLQGTPYGGSVGVSEDFSVLQFEVSVGSGYNLGYTVTASSFYSARHNKTYSWND